MRLVEAITRREKMIRWGQVSTGAIARVTSQAGNALAGRLRLVCRKLGAASKTGGWAQSGVYRKAVRFHLPSIMLLDHLGEVPTIAASM
jgi:hypothetical protein